ncbi:GTPase [Aeromonas veronii]|uniref:GTPase n=1 Tax=Aeromonas veronii TaxID=654 RepID=UPI003D1D26E3
MQITSSQLYDTYKLTSQLIADYPVMQKDFEDVMTQFEDKLATPGICVMVYGIYNAGKSTLINALLGEEAAPTGDIPLTCSVGAYRWNNHTILDTPGVDAPLEHEEVTKAQMMTADAIIFVVNPSGAAEEEKTLKKLIDLLEEKKKLFLVFNEKNPLGQEDFIRLKDQTRSRLQVLAADRGMSSILQDIPIMRVNAARALKGKLSGQQGLVNNSGYPELETALNDFIGSIDQNDVNQRLANTLQTFLSDFLAQLSNSSSSDMVRKYDELLKRLVKDQNNCRHKVSNQIGRSSKQVYERSKSAIRKDPSQCQPIIEQIYQEASSQVVLTLEDELNYLVSSFRNEIEILESALDREQLRLNSKGDIPTFTEPHDASAAPRDSVFSRIDGDMIGQGFKTLSGAAKPEHIISALKLTKEWFPSLMKGIGPKTMEKIGAKVVGKYIPYVGTGITVLMSMWDLYQGDPANKQMQDQYEQMQRERERFEREVEDIAQNLGNQFDMEMRTIVRAELDPRFTQMSEKLETSLTAASGQDQAIRVTTLAAQELLTRLQVA